MQWLSGLQMKNRLEQIEKIMKSRWAFAFFAMPLAFFLTFITMKTFMIPHEKEREIFMPVAFLLIILNSVITGQFSHFKNRFIGFSVLMLLAILSATGICSIFFEGLLPMP